MVIKSSMMIKIKMFVLCENNDLKILLTISSRKVDCHEPFKIVHLIGFLVSLVFADIFEILN